MTKLDHLVETIKEQCKNLPEPMAKQIKAWYPNDPFKILVSCILSLRSKDSTLLPLLPTLFAAYKTPADFAKADLEKLATIIKPSGFFQKKAQTLQKIAQELIANHHGQVPNSYQALMSLPGVGPKTANLVLAEAFNIPAICVDTHVHRLSNHMGIVKTKTPEQTQVILEKVLPLKYWCQWNNLLVTWGQNICKPKCKQCKCPKLN
jgi:endonuclease-3